jgi:predicted  nucleic acid-binding Zn ribbon protein
MATKRTELEARLLEEHGRVISVVQRWQSEQQAVDEVRASLAEAEARLDEAVLEGAKLGDRSMVARLLDLPEAQVRKAIAGRSTCGEAARCCPSVRRPQTGATIRDGSGDERRRFG